MSPVPYDLPKLKSSLLEIIDAMISIVEDDKAKAMLVMKKSIRRFIDVYRHSYKLMGANMRIRVKGRMYVGLIGSYQDSFPKSEALWRFLYEYLSNHKTEFIIDHSEMKEEYLRKEKESIAEVGGALDSFPIEQCNDYMRVLWAFDTMIHMAHLGSDYVLPDKPERGAWNEITPWQLPEGKSMLVDYWWNVPMDLRPKGHYVIEKLASSEIRSVDELKRLREEVLGWK